MKRIWIILAILAAGFMLIGGGKYAGMVILTTLMPVYALLLASIIFIIFLVAAAIAVAISRELVNRAELRSEQGAEVGEKRKAA